LLGNKKIPMRRFVLGSLGESMVLCTYSARKASDTSTILILGLPSDLARPGRCKPLPRWSFNIPIDDHRLGVGWLWKGY
jgi:hypothetical protein